MNQILRSDLLFVKISRSIVLILLSSISGLAGELQTTEELEYRIRMLELDKKQLERQIARQQEELANVQSLLDSSRISDSILYSWAIEAFQNPATTTSIQSLEDARSKFIKIRDQFPESNLIPRVDEKINQIDRQIQIVSTILPKLQQFDNALKKQKWLEAKTTFDNLRPFLDEKKISDLQYDFDNAKKEAKYKVPKATTINRLLTASARLKANGDADAQRDFIRQVFTFPATLTHVYRSNMMVTAQSDGWGKGSTVDVIYAGTNMETFLTDNDPKCCANRYQIVGTIKQYRDTGSIYIEAISIKKLQ